MGGKNDLIPSDIRYTYKGEVKAQQDKYCSHGTGHTPWDHLTALFS